VNFTLDLSLSVPSLACKSGIFRQHAGPGNKGDRQAAVGGPGREPSVAARCVPLYAAVLFLASPPDAIMMLLLTRMALNFPAGSDDVRTSCWATTFCCVSFGANDSSCPVCRILYKLVLYCIVHYSIRPKISVVLQNFRHITHTTLLPLITSSNCD
jgi:hypothetical protein